MPSLDSTSGSCSWQLPGQPRHPQQVAPVLGGAITGGVSERVVRGLAAQWVHELTTLAVGHDFDTFPLWAEGPEQLWRVAEEIVPVVRAQVARERAAG